jgi:hypothetical protein
MQEYFHLDGWLYWDCVYPALGDSALMLPKNLLEGNKWQKRMKYHY